MRLGFSASPRGSVWDVWARPVQPGRVVVPVPGQGGELLGFGVFPVVCSSGTQFGV